MPTLMQDTQRVLTTFTQSPSLAEKLMERKTHLIGTLRSNRKGLPKQVTSCKLKKGEVSAMENGSGIVALKWHDKRDVLILSTKHDDTMSQTGKKNRHNEAVVKPSQLGFATTQTMEMTLQIRWQLIIRA